MEWVASLLMVVSAFVSGLFPVHTFSYVATAVAVPPKTTILFGGDMMFDRSIRVASEKSGGDFIFSCIDQTLAQGDAFVANLEGPITAAESKSEGSSVGGAGNFTFTFPPSTASLLKIHRVTVVNLGNNHISNFSAAGVLSTERYLDGAGVQWFGDPIEQKVATSTIKSIAFAFINYNQFERSSSASTTIIQIQLARASGYLPVVYTHWGEEYKPATDSEKRLAHEFVDAGAAIVVGSHPHVIQEHEFYRGVPIYYSLGNFIFDQYWDDAVRTGLLLRVTFDKHGVAAVEETPVTLERDRRTCVASSSLTINM